MIYERFRRYSHLPHQVANNSINCHDTKLSKYQNILVFRKLCIMTVYAVISNLMRKMKISSKTFVNHE